MYVVSSGIQNMESVSLPDGTKVQMGPGSRLTYPASFSGKTREIRLDGQAFFDVAKNREKPFIVHTEDMSVEALGTAFELFSYNMENKMEAILLNGKIKVSVGDKETNQMKEYFVSLLTKRSWWTGKQARFPNRLWMPTNTPLGANKRY